jgi:hypothetical protein
VRAVLKTEFLLGRSLPAVFFHEPVLPTGLPDLVAVYVRPAGLSMNRTRLRLCSSHVRLLHYLHLVGPVSQVDATAQLNMSARKLGALLDDLIDAELVVRRDQILDAKALQRIFGVKYIVAIEAKVRDWRKALEQAAANHWFASHSYILVPASDAVQRICANAAKLGIGVLVCQGEAVCVAAPAKSRPIPASYGSWLLNEWALRRLGRV